MAAKFFTGLPLDGPDPECVLGHGASALAERGDTVPPKPVSDHSRGVTGYPRGSSLAVIPARPAPLTAATRPCDESPVGHEATV